MFSFFVRSKNDISSIAKLKYYLHKFRETRTTLKMPNNLSMTFIYCTQCPQNSQSMLTINVCRSTGIQRVCHIP